MKRTNDLGRDPVLSLVLRLAIPTMLAQLVSVLYSIVDRIYIGNIPEVGGIALAGVGVCGPIVTLLSSFASLVGLGGSPIMAMRMGEGRKDTAQKVLNNCFLMLLALSLALTLGFLLAKDKLLMWFGASDVTFPYADTYMTIYTAGTFFALMANGMNNFLICQGFSGLGMATVMLGAVLNIVLDPVFIFLCGMGVAGAAIATVLSQMASCVFVLCMLLGKRVPVRLGWGGFDRRIMVRVLGFGLSPFLIIATDSVLLIILNTVLQRYGGPGLGDTLVTCATIVQSYLLLITMPMGGMTLGTQPVVSFNYGAGQPQRIREAMKAIVGLCVLFCVLMMVVTHTLSPLFVRLFTADPDIAARSVRYIKMFTCMIVPLAVQYPLVDETTALGHVKRALFCSLYRKSIYLAALLLLPWLFGPEATFFSEPLADLLAAIMTTILFLHTFPKVLKECGHGAARSV
ncbi:MATE family efflux transporter [Pseudoflavonifractor sp. MSJ-37]|uniref:MATE family efflux transporter n=1 Tax=Pseudoflavonifractor sp. MSJ-37 TaxID=2841531 RepID=UPI001C12767C|nr:MATE family efflux transporter [Pseudoflavonifractor sp. MSJ-37]MBU5434122.1 MATE family efflux transporter [Pseudoflavonifractor sp. MSJ-37]